MTNPTHLKEFSVFHSASVDNMLISLWDLGVRTGELRQTSGGSRTWVLQCFRDAGVSNEACKLNVSEYIREKWSGSQMTYYVPKNAMEDEFHCRFHSDILR